MTDEELLRRHLAGDPQAFGQLVRGSRNRLWSVALGILGNPDEAADAVQDALLAAYRGAAGYRGEAAVSTWLHRIVVNSCLDLVRRRRAQPTDPALLPDAPVSHPTDEVLVVRAALRTLPAEQAAALVLVDMYGYPVSEAAAVLEVPVGTVKSRCARGRARLAQMLGGNRAGPAAVPAKDGPADSREEAPDVRR